MSQSRRDFLATSAAAAIGAAFARPVFAQQAQRARAAQPQAVFTPIRRNVGTFTMMGGTVGWLVNAGGVAVVDTQFPDSARALLAELRSRSKRDAVDIVLNTHHHGDHTSGNPIFRGVAKHVVAHTMADQHMRHAPGSPLVRPVAATNQAGGGAQATGADSPATDAPEPLYPDTTFTHLWTGDLGDERIVARHHGRGHTSGDAVITFERANVVHMGDLMFHQRHPVVDRAAGASLRHWAKILEHVEHSHDKDTIYIFGHAGTGKPVTGTSAELRGFRDYLAALIGFVETQAKAGKSREEIMTMREPLSGFEAWGRFGQPGARDPLTVAYEEVTTGT